MSDEDFEKLMVRIGALTDDFGDRIGPPSPLSFVAALCYYMQGYE